MNSNLVNQNTFYTLNCGGKIISLETPIIMGIINATPDSFYKGSRVVFETDVLKKCEQMLSEGAYILDIGGNSSRPYAQNISEEEELKRCIPNIESIMKHFPETILSIDTFRSNVAKKAVEAGAKIVNDISGGLADENMISTVAKLNVPLIVMHRKGNSADMQINPTYKNVVLEVLNYLTTQSKKCQEAGIKDVILDVGFGFGKNLEHNYELLRNHQAFKMLEKPLLVGISRKSLITKKLNIKTENALNGTSILHTFLLQKGANILRVHDVKEAKETIELWREMEG